MHSTQEHHEKALHWQELTCRAQMGAHPLVATLTRELGADCESQSSCLLGRRGLGEAWLGLGLLTCRKHSVWM